MKLDGIVQIKTKIKNKNIKTKPNIAIKNIFLDGWGNLYGLCTGDVTELMLTFSGVIGC